MPNLKMTGLKMTGLKMPILKMTGLRSFATACGLAAIVFMSAVFMSAVIMPGFGAEAAVLTFDDLTAPTDPLTAFDYGGLTFSTATGCGMIDVTDAGCMYLWDGSSPNSNGTNNLIFSDLGRGQTVTITQTGGGVFDFLGLDMSLSWLTSTALANVTINGTAYSLGQGITTLATNLFGVTSVSISGLSTDASGYWLADNINTGAPAPVPLPASLPLMLAALAAMGLLARRSKPGRKRG